MRSGELFLLSKSCMVKSIIALGAAFVIAGGSVDMIRAEELSIVVLDDGAESLVQSDNDSSSDLVINIDDGGYEEEAEVSSASIFDTDDLNNLYDILPVYEESTKPRLVSVSHYQEDWEGDTKLAACDYTTVLLENTDSYPELFNVLNQRSQSEQAEAQTTYQKMVADTREQYVSYGSVYTNFYESSVMVRRADEKLVSLLYFKSQYNGGAHGYSWEEPYTYNAQTGEVVGLSDIFTSTDSLLQIIYEKLNAKYPGLPGLTSTDGFGYWDVVTLDTLLFTVEPESITFYFPTYTLGSYADSSQNITIGFDEYPDLFTNLTAADTSEQVSEIASWYPVSMDVTGDGSADTIGIKSNYSSDYNMCTGFTVDINGQEYTFDLPFYNAEFYLVRTASAINLFAYLSVEEELSELHVIDMNGGSPAYAAAINYGNVRWDGEYSSIVYTELITDPAYFRLAARTDILGTGSVFGVFRTDDNGVPVLDNMELYTIHPRALTTKQDITGEEAEMQGDEMTLTGSSAVIPAESSVHLLGTDNSTYADVESEDGTIIRIPVETDEYPQQSDGTDVEELFDNVLFVG